jgi:hypothetical protein
MDSPCTNSRGLSRLLLCSSISNSNNNGLRIDGGSNLGIYIAGVNFIDLRSALFVTSSSQNEKISVSLWCVYFG